MFGMLIQILLRIGKIVKEQFSSVCVPSQFQERLVNIFSIYYVPVNFV